METIITYRLAGLTDMQRRMLRLAAAGATTNEIARRLGLDTHTAQSEIASLLGALGVTSAHQASVMWWGSRAGAPAALVAAATSLLAAEVSASA
jgi:DNA-binding CsgD family transcriptional regulator